MTWLPTATVIAADTDATGARFCTVITTVEAAELIWPLLTTKENVSAPETPGAVNVGFGLETLLRTTEVPPV